MRILPPFFISNHNINYIFILIIAWVISDCKRDFPSGPDLDIKNGTVKDFDGNTYNTIRIGHQWWMAENLKVTHYRNGDPIPNVFDGDTWVNLTIGAYCNYENRASNVTTYGRLYNWYTVSESRGLAPIGWHIPSDSEWQTLVDSLGGYSGAGGKIKATGTLEDGTGLWLSPNEGASNSNNFFALPSGIRASGGDGYFGSMDYRAFFWSSTELSNSNAGEWELSFDDADIIHTTHGYSKKGGLSIRCVMDN